MSDLIIDKLTSNLNEYKETLCEHFNNLRVSNDYEIIGNFCEAINNEKYDEFEGYYDELEKCICDSKESHSLAISTHLSSINELMNNMINTRNNINALLYTGDDKKEIIENIGYHDVIDKLYESQCSVM
jgi:hypothetical protein